MLSEAIRRRSRRAAESSRRGAQPGPGGSLVGEPSRVRTQAGSPKGGRRPELWMGATPRPRRQAGKGVFEAVQAEKKPLARLRSRWGAPRAARQGGAGG